MAQNKTLKDTKASKKDRQENTVPIGRDRSKSKVRFYYYLRNFDLYIGYIVILLHIILRIKL